MLQIQFQGRSLESYLNEFGQKFFVSKTLKKVSDNGAKVIKAWTADDKTKKKKREIANQKAVKMFENFSKKISHPYQNSTREEEN